MAFGGDIFTTGHSGFQTMGGTSFETPSNAADASHSPTPMANVESTNTVEAEPTSTTSQTAQLAEQQAEGETTSIAFSPGDQQAIAAFMRDMAANRSQGHRVTMIACVVTRVENGKE